jgi:glycosyltransferase involved in cell wall biosynthesis
MESVVKDDLVSVVIPTYNRGAKILRAVSSVLRQTYGNLELIVVDDASTDGTAALLESVRDSRLRLVRHRTNRGAATARNSGVAAARGRWIAFQDSDDIWLPEHLYRQIQAIRELPEDYVALFCTKINYGLDLHGRYGSRSSSCIPRPEERIESGDLHPRLLQGNIIGPQTALIAREAFLAVGGFDERLRNNEDWDFFIRLSERGRIGFLDDPLVIVMTSEDSISRNCRYSAVSFVTIYGKIRRRTRDRQLLASHASAVGTKLRRIGRTSAARLYFRKSIQLDPAVPRTYLKLLYTYFPQAPATGRLRPVAPPPGASARPSQ